eukprot:g26590.t1
MQRKNTVNPRNRNIMVAPRPRGRPGQPVKCMDTGEVFRSVTEAARAMGVTDEAIFKAMRKNQRSAGFRWQRIEAENTL